MPSRKTPQQTKIASSEAARSPRVEPSSVDKESDTSSVSSDLAADASQTIVGFFDLCAPDGFTGWCAEPQQPGKTIYVEIVADGTTVARSMANLHRKDVAEAGIGKGNHGFALRPPASLFDGKPHRIQVREVGSGYELTGSPKIFQATQAELLVLRADLHSNYAEQLVAACESIEPTELTLRVRQALYELALTYEQKKHSKTALRIQKLLDGITRARCEYRIEGFASRDKLQGWARDKSDATASLTVELLENGTVIASALNDGVDLKRGRGKFVLLLPTTVLDGALHRFDLRVAEYGGQMCTWEVVTPTSSRHARDADLGFLQDSIWRGIPSAQQVQLVGQERPEMSDTDRRIIRLTDALEQLEQEDIETKYRLLCDLANAYREGKRLDEAAATFKMAIQVDGTTSEAIHGHITTLMSLSREVEAEAEVSRALRKNPDDVALLELNDRLSAARRPKSARTVAFYLPQFHPVPENDEWWGRGFTEWTNVGGATPLFDGHLQPRRPTALGYYDLRLPASANAQFDLAKQYGIDGFCYYYYWFHGKRLLERPLQDLVDGKTGPFPFCICWANEDWTRSWDGSSGEVLLAQDHTPESDLAFIKDVAPMLRHQDYIRWNGKAVVLIYRADKLADPARTTDAWRKWCRRNGVGELHLCAVQSFGYGDPRPDGFDAAVEFPPHCAWVQHPELRFHSELEYVNNLVPGFAGKLYDYQVFAAASIARPREPYTLHRTAMVAWDNTARRQKTAHVFHQFSVETFEHWLSSNVRKAALEQQDSLSFVNAWNEWAEGTVMEPDDRFGYEILEASRRARRAGTYAAHNTYWRDHTPGFPERRVESRERILVFGHDAFPAGAQRNLLNMARCLKRQLNMDVVIFLIEGGDLLGEYERVGPTRVLGTDGSWREDLRNELRKYASLGTRKAICNTIATGEIAEILKSERYRVVSLVHELPTLIETKGLAHHCWRIAGNSDNIVFASRVVGDHFCDRYWPDDNKILIAPQGIVQNRHHSKREVIRGQVRDELRLETNTQIVIGCGYGDTRKGIDLFVQMASDVRRRMGEQPVAFVWVGEIELGMAPYVLADIERLELHDIFHVTGLTDDPGRYFLAADMFALTSREDPFPSVVLEAFDAYLPVVAFDGGGGYVDVVGDKTGKLVPYLDVGAMSEAIADLLKRDRVRKQIGESAHAICAEQFAYPAYMRKLLALLGGTPVAQLDALALESTGGKQNRPTISVIVPNYNYGRFLELRLRTILDQTLPPDEIIILDDASTDYSVAMIKEVTRESKIPVQLVTNKANTGNPFAQWSKGLALAKGDLIWIAEADDYCEPTLLETLAGEFTDSKVAMAWVDSIMVDESGQSSGFAYKNYYDRNYGSKWHMHFRMSGKALMDDCLIAENVFPNASAVLFRRSAVPKDLNVIQQYKFSGDWWFWLCVASTGDVAYRADALNYHRRHAQSVMGEVLREGIKLLPETMNFYQRIAKLRPQFLSHSSRLQLVKRLEFLYGLFPEMVGEHARLGAHPRFATQYEALVEKLNLPEALVAAGRQRPVTLVMSADVFDVASSISSLLDQLERDYQLTIVLIASQQECNRALDALGLHHQPHLVVDPDEGTRIGSKAAKALAAQARIEAALGASTTDIMTYGLEAHVLVGPIVQRQGSNWTILAGREFDVLLGKLPSTRSVTVRSLRDAIGHSARALVIGEDGSMPHAFARMAQGQKVPVERMQFKPGGPKHSRAAENARSVRFVAIATNAESEKLYRLAKVLHDEKVDLLVLAWGDRFEALKTEYATAPNVEVASVFEKPHSFSGLGDVGLLFTDGSTAFESFGSELRREGMQVCELRAEWADLRKIRSAIRKAIQSVSTGKSSIADPQSGVDEPSEAIG